MQCEMVDRLIGKLNEFYVFCASHIELGHFDSAEAKAPRQVKNFSSGEKKINKPSEVR